jgi:hypothetical protein
VKKKYEKFRKMKEKQQQKKTEQQEKVQRIAARASQKFIGMISSCFDGYMDVYIRQEDLAMAELLEKLAVEETWTISETQNINNKVLTSSTDLVYAFVDARKRCLALSKGQTFYELCVLLKKYMGKYAEFLNTKLKSIEKLRKPLSDDDEQSLCLIINTAEYRTLRAS